MAQTSRRAARVVRARRGSWEDDVLLLADIVISSSGWSETAGKAVRAGEKRNAAPPSVHRSGIRIKSW
ncbi:hypothetical protein PT2222_260047 [Paraburkholderia tropica]